MGNEIEEIMNALEKKQVHIVNDFLKEKWKSDTNLFISTVTSMRNHNASLADAHFNSTEFVQQFTTR